MAIGQGHAARCALGVESVYETAVAVTEIIPFSSESINKIFETIEDTYLDGSPGRRQIVNNLIAISGGELSGELVYDEIAGAPIGCERLIRGALGASARDAGNGLNKYYMANELDDHYTLVFNKQVSAWETVSAKFGSLELTGTLNERVTFSAGDIIAANLKRTGDAGIVNAIAAVTSLSPTNLPQPVLMKDASFRIADQGDAIADGDKIAINGFTLTVSNSLTDSEWSTDDSVNTDQQTSLEPLRNGFREVTFSIQIPRYTSDQMFTWQNSDTPLQADLKFASGGYQFNILIPYLKITEPSAGVGGPELIKEEVSFTVLMNLGRNTDMTFQDSTAIVGEIGIECLSARTTAA